MGLLSGSSAVGMRRLNSITGESLASGAKVTKLDHKPAQRTLKALASSKNYGPVTADQVVRLEHKAALEQEWLDQQKRRNKAALDLVKARMDRLEDGQTYSQEMMNQESRYQAIMGRQSMAVNDHDYATSSNRAKVEANNMAFLGGGGFGGFNLIQHPTAALN